MSSTPKALIGKRPARRIVGAEDLPAKMVKAVSIRVIYGDTDQMGVVYHGTYPRFLEAARVELMRSLGACYRDTERAGVGLPVIDLGISYRSPAKYDDIVSVYAGISLVTPARVTFVYRVVVEAGDRVGATEPVEIAFAESRHGCIDMQDGGATRMPDSIYEIFARHLSAQ